MVIDLFRLIELVWHARSSNSSEQRSNWVSLRTTEDGEQLVRAVTILDVLSSKEDVASGPCLRTLRAATAWLPGQLELAAAQAYLPCGSRTQVGRRRP